MPFQVVSASPSLISPRALASSTHLRRTHPMAMAQGSFRSRPVELQGSARAFYSVESFARACPLGAPLHARFHGRRLPRVNPPLPRPPFQSIGLQSFPPSAGSIQSILPGSLAMLSPSSEADPAAPAGSGAPSLRLN